MQLKIEGRYNWSGQPERMVYVGCSRYAGDRRDWHQFEKVDQRGTVWCEVLESDLVGIEETVDRPVDPIMAAGGLPVRRPAPLIAKGKAAKKADKRARQRARG